MDRINNTGKKLIEYKKEYGKHYSFIVDESLRTSLDGLKTKNVLNDDTYNKILDDKVSLKDFEIHIMSKRDYLKSMKELIEEFDKVRKIVNDSLIRMNFVDFIETENNIESDTITILRQYSLTEDFIQVYFGLEEKDMESIMKKRGFAEKFAVLRLTKVFKEILSEMRTETDYSQGFSKVYYNPDINCFSVDYKYHINVNTISVENIDNKIKKIKEADKVVERKFLKKTGMGFYNVKPISAVVDQPKENKNVPKNKKEEPIISQDELDRIQSQLISQSDNLDINDDIKNKRNEKDEIKTENIPNDNKDKVKKLKVEEPKQPEIKIDDDDIVQVEDNKIIEIPDDFADAINEELNGDNIVEVIGDIPDINMEEDFSGDFDSDFNGFQMTMDGDFDIDDVDIPNIDMDLPDDLPDDI